VKGTYRDIYRKARLVSNKYRSSVAMFGVLSLLTACGQASEHPHSPTATTASSIANATSAERTPGTQEVARARKCLDKEGVRRAGWLTGHRHPHSGSTGLIRYGLPVTKQEYVALVQRCNNP
jgi:hypothetical protein